MNPENGNPAQALKTTSSLEGLQSDEQRNVLNTVDQLRKCGLESMLSLPQLVICGDQSAGKGSVLEALTEKKILRRATSDAITIKVIPDNERPAGEQVLIKAFKESIEDLPYLMNKARETRPLWRPLYVFQAAGANPSIGAHSSLSCGFPELCVSIVFVVEPAVVLWLFWALNLNSSFHLQSLVT